ncbi:hypothetical protein ACFV3E_40945 [Streptomyces sp. NPDC059718]
MAQLAERLSALAAAGEPITFHAVALTPEAVTGEVAEVAASPYAPLLAEAVVHAFDPAGDSTDWNDAAQWFPAGFAGQRSVLAFNSALETLLNSPVAARVLGRDLTNALLEDLGDTVVAAPLLAAARLEGAVRLAVAGAAKPYRVWDALDDLTINEPEDFLERLPRILGLALDQWCQEREITETARDLLERLAHYEAADVDAMFELGCDRLRRALASDSIADVTSRMAEARQLFAAAAAAEEARDDAEAYTAVCDAVLGFSAGNTQQVGAAADRIAQALERRAAWLHGSHQPTWLQPQRTADLAWSRLLLQLRAAAETLDAPVWMNPWRALDSVLAAYSTARTVQPIGSNQATAGVATLIEPAIEDRFLREQSFLAALQHAATQPRDDPASLFDADTAALVLARIDARETSTPKARETDGDDDNDDTGPATERLLRIVPTVVLRLGLTKALNLTRDIDDAALADLEGLAYNDDVARLKATDPLIVPLLIKVTRALEGHAAFTGDVKHTFGALVEQTLLFLKSRSDLTRTSLFGPGKKDDPPYDYRRKPEKGHRQAAEHDLQRDFHGWLLAGPLNGIVQVEPINVEMGRADVMVHFGVLHYLTEIKQDADSNTRDHIEGKYLTQAAQYTNTNAPFGQLLVLDLTPKTKTSGTQRVDELAWTTIHRPRGATTDRAVLAGIVTGNRITPSAYST